MPTTQSAASKKILIVAPAWVGDMVMSQTLYQLLKQQDPNVILDVIAPPATAPLARCMPEIRNTTTIPNRYGELTFKQRFQIARALRQERYDTALILPNSFMSALLPFLARIPQRIGWARECRSFILTDARRLDKKRWPLMIERFMALALAKTATLAKPYPRPCFTINPNTVAATRDQFNLHDPKPILALCPGAEFGPAKRWPEQYYAEVAEQRLKAGWQVWLFGSKKDQAVTAAIQKSCHDGCVDLTGRTNLVEAVDLLSCATQVLCNDSGLMHIAAALSRPLVVIYGSTDPGFTPPLTDHVKILRLDLPCSPCFERECPLQHLKCLRDLKPAVALQALDEL